MIENDARGVQKLEGVRTLSRPGAVQFVSDNGMAEVGEMNTYLMCASRNQLTFKV